MKKLLKTTPFHRLALASAAALSMAGAGVVAAQDIDTEASMQGAPSWQERCEAGFNSTGGEVTAAALERVSPSCDGSQAQTRDEVRQQAMADTPEPPAAPVGGEAGSVPAQIDDRADVTEPVGAAPLTREEVQAEAVQQQRENPDAGVGEAGDLRQQIDESADITSDSEEQDAIRALRDASSSADDASTGAFVVNTDEGPMLLIVTDDAQAPYTLVALEDAMIVPVQ